LQPPLLCCALRNAAETIRWAATGLSRNVRLDHRSWHGFVLS
jgi:hypothetical protein